MGLCRHNVRVPPFFFSALQLALFPFTVALLQQDPLKILLFFSFCGRVWPAVE